MFFLMSHCQHTKPHTGNGTSDIFEHDPSVLFISTHQQGIYPFQGKVTDVGKGDGEGATMHVPLPGMLLMPCMLLMCANACQHPQRTTQGTVGRLQFSWHLMNWLAQQQHDFSQT